MKPKISLGLRAYRMAAILAQPFLPLFLANRERKGLEDGSRMAERRGFPSRARPGNSLAWVHGASVGEVISLLPVVERLTQRGIRVLVTSGTRSSATLIARRLPPGAFHQFMPLDTPRYIRRFLNHWRPDIALFAESELWPTSIIELCASDVPLILVNARMSDKSFNRWQRFPGTIRSLLRCITLCLTQSLEDAHRYARLGAPHVAVTGNLKFDAPAPPADQRAVAQMSGLIAGRPVWLAASTHPGEDEIVLSAHIALMQRYPDLLTIIAPRHPHRGRDIAALADQAGLSSALRSEGLLPDQAVQVYIADSIGEMGIFYRLSPVVAMGGSFVPHGGQNPIEPIKLGASILHGPHIHNFKEVYSFLDHEGGALLVSDGQYLAEAVADMLASPDLMRDMARAGLETVSSLSGAIERTVRSIEPFVARIKMGARR